MPAPTPDSREETSNRRTQAERELLAATMERVLDDLRDDYERRFDEFDGQSIDARGLAELIGELTGDSRLLTVLELTVESRNDAALRALVEPVIARHRATMHTRVRALLHDQPIGSWPLLGGAVDTVVLALQGMQLHDAVVRDPEHMRMMRDFMVASVELAFAAFNDAAAARLTVE